MPSSPPRSVSAIRLPETAPSVEARSPWVWWHLLSLDAPTVAVVWCWFFGAVFGLHFAWTTLPTLALGTWCVYVADRLLDGWRATDTAALRDRHWFYLRHRRLFLIAWCAAAVPLAYLIFFRTQPAVRTDDVMLCWIGVAYFTLIHGFNTGPRFSRIPENRWLSRMQSCLSKELAVGFLFAIATAVPAWAQLHTERKFLAAAILTFGAACWLNCVAIQTWEDAESEREIVHAILSAHISHDARKRPRSLTEFLGAHLNIFALAVALQSAAFIPVTAHTNLYPLFASVAVSAVLFLGLIRNSRRFSALSLRIAADAALLTPLLFLLRVR